MSDLTEDELNAATTVHDRLSAVNVNAWVDPVALIETDRLQRAALEIRRHRAALAADRERVRSVVESAAAMTLSGALTAASWRSDVDDIARRLADRAAEQLATGALPLWAKFAVQKLHEQVDQTDPNDPVGIALTRAGLERCP